MSQQHFFNNYLNYSVLCIEEYFGLNFIKEIYETVECLFECSWICVFQVDFELVDVFLEKWLLAVNGGIDTQLIQVIIGLSPNIPVFRNNPLFQGT